MVRRISRVLPHLIKIRDLPRGLDYCVDQNPCPCRDSRRIRRLAFSFTYAGYNYCHVWHLLPRIGVPCARPPLHLPCLTQREPFTHQGVAIFSSSSSELHGLIHPCLGVHSHLFRAGRLGSSNRMAANYQPRRCRRPTDSTSRIAFISSLDPGVEDVLG
jgi:hypothetical protein